LPPEKGAVNSGGFDRARSIESGSAASGSLVIHRAIKPGVTLKIP
jgi:hypothetical protein